MNTTYYIGLDVHKDSIAIAHTRERDRKEPTYHGSCGGSNLSAERALRKLAKKLGVDLRRFDHPSKLTAFVGLVPDENSSGLRRRQGGITKCGNAHARWMLVECAQHFRKAPKIGSALSKRQEGQPQEVKELAWRMQNRLHARYVRLKARGKREPKALVAIARELCTFIWELHNKIDLPKPGDEDPK